MVSWAKMPRSPGHAFYDKLKAELIKAGFDGFVEGLCAPRYAARRGRPSLPQERYFRMLLVGYFEGTDGERDLVWRSADSLSFRASAIRSRPCPLDCPGGAVNAGHSGIRRRSLACNWPACMTGPAIEELTGCMADICIVTKTRLGAIALPGSCIALPRRSPTPACPSRRLPP